MAAVHAELRLRDGLRRTVQVQTQTHALGSLITAVRELSHRVTCLLTELVQQEQDRGACTAERDSENEEDEDEEDGEDEDGEDEDGEDEDGEDCGPDPKRTKT